MKKQLFIISLGGSLINPGRIDVKFLKQFKQLVLPSIKSGNQFIFVTGGGKSARKYLEALRAVGSPSADDLDWMGIFATRLNAELVRMMFGRLAHPQIVTDPNKKLPVTRPVLVGGGWKPGRSTDDIAVRLAKTYGARAVINLSNIDYVYTKDPRKFKDARAIKNISWKNFRKIVGNKWDPGKNLPFDPTAAKLAEKLGLKVTIANGKNLANLKNILGGKKFKGTIIE